MTKRVTTTYTQTPALLSQTGMIGVETSSLVARSAKQQEGHVGILFKGKDKVGGPETLEPRDAKSLR